MRPLTTAALAAFLTLPALSGYAAETGGRNPANTISADETGMLAQRDPAELRKTYTPVIDEDIAASVSSLVRARPDLQPEARATRS